MTDGPAQGWFTPYSPQQWIFSDVPPACKLCGRDAVGEIYGCVACWTNSSHGGALPTWFDMPACQGHVDMILLDRMVNG